MKHLKTLLILATMLTSATAAYSGSHAGAPMAASDAKKTSAAPMSADMADGEVRKIDLDNKKITIKHGVIKSLDMPGMTMVFQVKDAALLSKTKVGDKVRFSAEKVGSAIVVTDIQPVK